MTLEQLAEVVIAGVILGLVVACLRGDRPWRWL